MQTFWRMLSQPRVRVLSIQSEVVSGYVGNTAARFALQRMGIDVLALPTVLFSNHPGHGGFRGQAVSASDLTALLDGLTERGFLAGIGAVMSGYLGRAEHAPVVRDAVQRVRALNPEAIYLLDPVFGDDAGAYARPGVAEAMATQLLPLADIVTPNRFELAALSGREVGDASSAILASRSLGRRMVLATSVPMGSAIGTAVVTPEQAWLAEAPRVVQPSSGTGDLLAALFLGHILRGLPAQDALGRAAGTVDRLIRASAGSKDMDLIGGQGAITEAAPLPVSGVD